jgi:ABC-type nickel/cobalt efflux system permease component RcnA
LPPPSLVLTYALANGTLLAELALTAVMALGIATTIDAVGNRGRARAAIRCTLALCGDDRSGRALRAVEIVSAAFVFAFGLAMLLGGLTPAARNPFSALPAGAASAIEAPVVG